jgi:hypothetical protein
VPSCDTGVVIVSSEGGLEWPEMVSAIMARLSPPSRASFPQSLSHVQHSSRRTWRRSER